MSIHLLEAVQQNLGYPALQKIDPNTQQVALSEKNPAEDKFSQAAIPAVLTGLYKYVQSNEGAEEFLRGENSPNWVARIFADHKKEVIQTISSYAMQPGEDPVEEMNTIANEAVRVVKGNLPPDATVKEVKFYFSNQRNNILLYLLPELSMGELLHDPGLDDKTNKMEGPISSLMKTIGAAFSSPVMDEEVKNS